MKLIALCALLAASACAADLRIGIVGTDTSHVIAFTKVLNDPTSPDHIPGAHVVAAYKGGSMDVKESASRVEGYAKELQDKWKVEIVPDIPSLCSKVDVVLLESVDGRKHLEQARQVIAAKKPMFIDKPLASTLADAREIAKLAKDGGVPWFTASSLRFSDIPKSLKSPDATGAIAWGPSPLEAHHELSMSWYGIHAVEILYAMMGTGCEEVTMVSTPDSDQATCRWKDGRIGTVRGLRPYSDFGAVSFRPKEILQSPPKAKYSYVSLVKEIIQFFQTGKPPVAPEETLEIFAFMDAAERSKAAGGKPMRLSNQQH